MQINEAINALLDFAIANDMILQEDVVYSANKIIDILLVNEFERIKQDNVAIENVTKTILDYATENDIIEDEITYRDLLLAKIMDCVMPRPSEVTEKFKKLYKSNPKKATDYFYSLSKSSQYIMEERVKKNIAFKTKTEYGDLDITINLSKPEKDPKVIALAKTLPQQSYPKCLLCYENVGFAGNINQPARQNHRVIPLTLNNEQWYMQYSPYVYYNEHCIVFNKNHTPMKITENTFRKLIDFTEIFPHYFIGSNADLPIVGGSILTHDHFQGGCYTFAMAEAESIKDFELMGYEDVKVSLLNWPLDVLRLRGNDKGSIIRAACRIFNTWRDYSDESANIIAYSDGEPHNTITPICRRTGENYELDLVLRNNRVDKEHPDGIFHPTADLHHIKKENIGLIEVMGLAVLPARLKNELNVLENILTGKESTNRINESDMIKHKEWAEYIKEKYSDINESNIEEIVKKETGIVFKKVLECCGVFRFGDKIKLCEKFINSVK